MSISDLLGNRARLSPDREALFEVATGTRYTYAELDQRADRAAAMLQTIYGVGPGDCVCLLAHNSVVYLDLLYGLPRIGAVFVPLNWRLAAAELVEVIKDCSPRVLIVGPEFAGVLAEMRPQPGVEVVLSVEDATIPGAARYEAVCAAASATYAVAPEDLEVPHCILYTSGTTGRPKGAIIPRRQVVWNCINTVISWGLGAADVTPVFTPLFHTGGLFAFMAPVLYAGGRVVMTRTFDAELSLRLIETEQCTVILGVPTIFRIWRESAGYHTADFSHVRFFISGGAPCPLPLMEAWQREKQIVFRQGYGLTEAGTNCFSMNDEESIRKAGSVGKPIFHSEMRLVDVDDRDVGVGEVGELLIRGPHVFSGYRNNPDATTAVLRDGWLHTGDMARRDADGFYSIVGRLKDMIISGGENIYAAEVEAVFRDHPLVADAALIGRPDEKWGEVGVMFVVAQPGTTPDGEEMLAFCGRRLARYKIPREIIFVDGLPYSPYGKVIKAELKEHDRRVGHNRLEELNRS